MAKVPDTRYAKSGDVHVAYQVWGDGPLNLVFVPGWISHVELMWEEPATARFFERLGAFATVAFFDKRGTGLSDPVPVHELPTLEQRMDDARAVMDAAGMEKAALLGISEGGAMGVLFAATYPERTTALVLYGCWAHMVRTEDYPWGLPPATLESVLTEIEAGWSRRGCPERAGSERRLRCGLQRALGAISENVGERRSGGRHHAHELPNRRPIGTAARLGADTDHPTVR